MEQLTVKQLYKLCENQIKLGNKDKLIVVSDDIEGNGYHGLYYGFTMLEDDETGHALADEIYDSQETDVNKVIILG